MEKTPSSRGVLFHRKIVVKLTSFTLKSLANFYKEVLQIIILIVSIDPETKCLLAPDLQI